MRKALGLLLALTPRLAAGASEPRLPLGIVVEVRQGPSAVPEVVVGELEEALRAELRTRGCFARVERERGSQADLVLLVHLQNAIEETRYDNGIADRASSQDPDVERALVSSFAMDSVVELRTLPGESLVIAKHFRTDTTRRPVTAGEDTTGEARSDAVVRAARQARRSVCAGSLDKLARAIEKARAVPPDPPPPR